jgi:4-hydroxybenzoate polyprenyltransferase
MVQTLRLLVKTARPRQWLKNLSLFTGLVFTGWLFIPEKFFTVAWAAVLFSLITSAVYIFNDITDAPADRLHPLKKKRPIASGELPVPLAFFAAVVLAAFGLFLAANLSFFFFFLCLAYALLHLLYSLYLKKVAILDVLAIASGFILRVYAGAVAIDAHINVWLLLCIISFSLFLAVGKRRSERTLLKAQDPGQTRKVLTHYPDELLNIYTSMFANTTWLTYALFTFLQPTVTPEGHLLTLMSIVPRAFVNQKLLMITVPVVIYGVMRYLQLIYEKGEGESPAKVLTSDKPLLLSVSLWGILVIGVIYGIG